MTTSFNGGLLYGLAIYPSTGTDMTDYGKIVAVGGQKSNIPVGVALARFNANGTADTTFGLSGSGQVITPFPSGGVGNAAALQADGKVVVTAVTTDASGNFWWSLLRYDTYGHLDPTFGNGGLVQTVTSGRSWAVAIQTDGKIVAAGYTPGLGSPPNDFMVARHLGAASPTGAPPTIPDPVSVGTDSTPTADQATPVAFRRDVVGDGVREAGTDALLGDGTRPRDGPWTVSFATAGWASGRSRRLVQAQDSDGVFGDPFALALTVP